MGLIRHLHATVLSSSTSRSKCYSQRLKDDEIRLLTIGPAAPLEDPLYGFLDIVSIHAPPPFSAISYRWAQTGDPKHVVHLPGCSLELTGSLYNALRYFRHRNRPVVLWADAVCINQNDIREKNSQVKQMGKIYSLAESTKVWMWEPQVSDPLAFWTISFLVDFARRLYSSGRYKPLDLFPSDVPHEFLRLFSDRLSKSNGIIRCSCCMSSVTYTTSPPQVTIEAALFAVLSIWQRPWFSRLWVIQEIVFGRNCHFYSGHHRIELQVLRTAALMQSNIRDIPAARMKSIWSYTTWPYALITL